MQNNEIGDIKQMPLLSIVRWEDGLVSGGTKKKELMEREMGGVFAVEHGNKYI